MSSKEATILFSMNLESGETLTLVTDRSQPWIECNGTPQVGCLWKLARMDSGIETFRKMSKATACSGMKIGEPEEP